MAKSVMEMPEHGAPSAQRTLMGPREVPDAQVPFQFYVIIESAKESSIAK
jgi:hypothetical protein